MPFNSSCQVKHEAKNVSYVLPLFSREKVGQKWKVAYSFKEKVTNFTFLSTPWDIKWFYGENNDKIWYIKYDK